MPKTENFLMIQQERLLIGDNIWNLRVVDNIDFMEKTFGYGNIYDISRKTMHAQFSSL